MDLNYIGLGRFEADFSSPLLFKRCASCPPTPPPCPTCASNEICSLIGGGCDSCAVTLCTPLGGSSSAAASSDAGSGSSKSSPAGPIAGGVIGGIAVICIMTFLVWRFCIKNRRQQFVESDLDVAPYDHPDGLYGGSMEKDPNYAASMGAMTTGPNNNEGPSLSRRDTRASTHSVRSIASTVLTRASNVIQIAYIPGVTNRSIDTSTAAPSSNDDAYIPPVPPMPTLSPGGSPQIGSSQAHSRAAVAPTSPHRLASTMSVDQHRSSAMNQHQPANHGGDHFFLPSDLRDSTVSNDVSRNSARDTSRDTYFPDDRSTMYSDLGSPRHPGSPGYIAGLSRFSRGSVPSTAYRGSALVDIVPAQTAIRGKANPVAVTSAPGMGAAARNASNNGSNGPRPLASPSELSPTTAAQYRLFNKYESSSAASPRVANFVNSGVKNDNSIIRDTDSYDSSAGISVVNPIIARAGISKAVTVTKSNSSNNSSAATSKNTSPVDSKEPSFSSPSTSQSPPQQHVANMTDSLDCLPSTTYGQSVTKSPQAQAPSQPLSQAGPLSNTNAKHTPNSTYDRSPQNGSSPSSPNLDNHFRLQPIAMSTSPRRQEEASHEKHESTGTRATYVDSPFSDDHVAKTP